MIAIAGFEVTFAPLLLDVERRCGASAAAVATGSDVRVMTRQR